MACIFQGRATAMHDRGTAVWYHTAGVRSSARIDEQELTFFVIKRRSVDEFEQAFLTTFLIRRRLSLLNLPSEAWSVLPRQLRSEQN